jgi:multicomponent Na+:H+ antiporter subunit C
VAIDVAGLWQNIDYAAFVVLFCIGLYVVIAKQNLIKKLLGLNIMETAVFAFIVTSGMVEGGTAPIAGPGAAGPFASPLPHAMVLTGIVVAVSITALALCLIIEIYRQCGSIEADELKGAQ